MTHDEILASSNLNLESELNEEVAINQTNYFQLFKQFNIFFNFLIEFAFLHFEKMLLNETFWTTNSILQIQTKMTDFFDKI